MHDFHLHDLDLDDRPEPWWRKPALLAVGILLAFLVFSLSFLSTAMSIAPSRPVEQNVLHFPNITIVFQDDTLESLQSHYIDNQEREIKACLSGSIDNSIYYVSKIDFPEVISASVAHVHASGCSDGSIIDLHSHPVHNCIASDQDVSVLDSYRARDESKQMLIMCSLTRFALV